MVRSIEQILGLPPMNIQDAIATPMFSCFTDKEDLTPYTAEPNRYPLDEMNKPLESLKGKALHYSLLSMDPRFDHVDAGDDDVFNRILWFHAKGNVPYPVKYAGKEEEEEKR
jgi:hypothetical protein